MYKILTFCSLLLLAGCNKKHKHFKPLNHNHATRQHNELEISEYLRTDNLTKGKLLNVQSNTINQSRSQNQAQGLALTQEQGQINQSSSKKLENQAKSIHINTQTDELEDRKKEEFYHKRMKAYTEIKEPKPIEDKKVKPVTTPGDTFENEKPSNKYEQKKS